MSRARIRLAHVTTEPRPRTAAECEARLESSALYQRRQMAARQAEVMARVSALWYLSQNYRERYWGEAK